MDGMHWITKTKKKVPINQKKKKKKITFAYAMVYDTFTHWPTLMKRKTKTLTAN